MFSSPGHGKKGWLPERGRRSVAVGGALVLVATLSIAGSAQATPTNFVELDGNVVKDGAGTFDWANSGALTTTGNDYTRAGTGGIFDGGHFNGNTTPPTAPSRTAASLADSSIADAEFKVDPLASDVTPCGTGDPTAYTGAGSEVNGGNIATDTFGTASVPPKDDVSNVYAAAHLTATVNEVFFGAERVINNGDSHIDFEFLQSAVSIPSACSGTFSGHRTQGDFLLSVDFTSGGTLGGSLLYQWHCAAEGSTQPAIGTVCDPPAHGKSVPHYQEGGITAGTVLVNAGTTAIGCGGWVCRNTNGSPSLTLAQNELMEGAIDLKQLGFTGCISTFLPHTRSSQSFTAVLKDFEIIPFNTCAHPTISTQVKKTSDDSNVANGGHISIGTSVYDTATLNGATASAGGTVTYKLYSDDTCTTPATQPTLDHTVTVTNAVVPNSNSITFNNAGTFYFQATYSGDLRNLVPAGGAKSACSSEVVVVDQNTPSIATQVKKTTDDSNVANNGHVPIGTSVYDTATLTGATAGAGGTVNYKLYTNDTCTTASTTPALDQNVTVTNGSVPNSNSVTFNNAGTYFFQATYSGDANNAVPAGGLKSGCNTEIVVVDKNPTSITTQVKKASDDSNVANNASVPIGTVVYDTSSITGATATAGGTVTYKLFSENTCTTLSTTPALNQSVTVTNGTAPKSNNVTFNDAGTFWFQATYSGDGNNIGSTSGCLTEVVTVAPNTPAPHSTPVVQIKDTLSVSGLTSGATGLVHVGLYTSSDCTTGQQGSDVTFAPAAAAGGVETSFVAELAGSYYYKISYAGDNNNTGFNSCAESVTVGITSVP
jgi:plastocyanin